MPTTARGYPYVVGSDTVTSYPTTSLALANAIESKLGGPVATGEVLIPATVAVNASTSLVVTLPAGRFTAAPQVLLSTAGSRLTAAVTGLTASSFTFYISNWANSDQTVSVAGYWMAFGKVP